MILPKQKNLQLLEINLLLHLLLYDKYFHLHQHLDRLNENLAAVRIPVDMTRTDWELLFKALLEKNQNQGPNQRIYLQITRGVSMLNGSGKAATTLTPSPMQKGFATGIYARSMVPSMP